MSTSRINISGLTVEVVRKNIKNLHLGVYPPHGRVRVAVPLSIKNDAVRLALIEKLGWIKRQQAKFEAQPRQSKREMVNGESHYYFGKRYRLRLVESRKSSIKIRNASSLELHVPLDASRDQRERILQNWYREQLRKKIPLMLTKWLPIVDVKISGWGIKKMKTKWGSCNPTAARIWLNLELAKKPVKCLEYILVHELMHLKERHHNEHFLELMTKVLPRWRAYKQELARMPLGHDDWSY